MKTFYKIAGIVFAIGCIFLLEYNYREIQVYKFGHLVNAKIVFVPNCITTKGHYYIKFDYKGKIYPKEIGVLTCKELNEGDTIRLKTDDSNIFLYENENPFVDMVSFIILFLSGVFLIYLGFKK